MPPAGTAIDPEAMLRSAMSSVAVAAHARGISIYAHVDLRLPQRLTVKSSGLERFLRRGLKRTVEAGQVRKIALAFWLDDLKGQAMAPGSRQRVLLEIGRQFAGATFPATPLRQLWTLPLGGHAADPCPVRGDDGVESITVPTDLIPAPGLAQPGGGRWRGVLNGRRLLEVRDPLYDRDRLRESIEALGARIDFARSAGEALDLLRAGVAEGNPVAAVTMDSSMRGLDPVDFARRLRGEAAFAGVRLVLTAPPDGAPLTAEAAALFDAVPVGCGPQRRILDVIYDLLLNDNPKPDSAVGPARASAIPRLGGKRVLIAEDVETNQMLLQAVLAPTGAAVEVVENGVRAIERHRAEPADLILMDLQMPGLGGIAALKQIRTMQGAAGTVPVLALTAYAQSSDRRKALEAGMDGYLAKPILIEEFYAALRRFLLPVEVA